MEIGGILVNKCMAINLRVIRYFLRTNTSGADHCPGKKRISSELNQ